ncbi:MAG TPA: hypothetical protein VFA31_01360, partial [Candidatus Polarisedimenticolia bacterium]|nr:hypothetical protein [Candidatus Polarisedimenticolia bacterium]
IEDRVRRDLELHDLRTARLRRQEKEPIDEDGSGAQTGQRLVDDADECGSVIAWHPIDGHVDRLNALTAESGLQPIDQCRAGPR